MGCCESKQHTTAASTIVVKRPKANQDQTEQMLAKGLENVKAYLAAQHKNKTMVAEMIKMIFTFVGATLSTGQAGRVEEFIGIAFMGLYMREGVTVDGVRYNSKIGGPLHMLTEPEELSRRNLNENFLSCAEKFEEIKKQRSKARDQGLMEEEEARGAYGEDDAKAPVAGGEAAAAVPKYAELQRIMLSILDPLCDLVDALLDVNLKQKFLRAARKPAGYLDGMRNLLGIVTTIVKVFQPLPEADSSRGLRLLAVMGPESYGKSTLINHILYNGQNRDFMPATPGMGTQVICKIAAGPLDTLQTSVDEFPQTGDVKHMVERENRAMRRKRDTRRGGELGIKEMEMLRATVKFDPPYPVQFLDVPGTKKETMFHTRVALGLTTTLVLVSGTVDRLRTQLESGDLCLLRDAVKGLGRSIPIQCLASFNITEKEFLAQKDHMKRTLQENFPTCSENIQEPLYMDFFQARDHAHRQAMVDKFYAAMASTEAKVMDPLERFGEIATDVETFTSALSGFLREEMQEYLSLKVGGLEGSVEEVHGRIDAFTNEMHARHRDLEGAFNPKNITDALERVRVGKLGTYRFNAQQQTLDVANYVQLLLNRCRLCHMGWLQECSNDFHGKSFGEALGPLKALTSPNQSQEKTFTNRLCATFQFCNQTARSNDEKTREWWRQKFTSHIAPYLDGTAFGCLLMGFYLVSTDTKIKVELMGLLSPQKKEEMERLNTMDNGVTDTLIKDLSEVNYTEWVKAVKDKIQSREQAFQELYEVIHKAGVKFEEIALRTGFLNKTNDNLAMKALVELTFVLMESVFVEIMEETGAYRYTRFSKHLQQSQSTSDLQSFKPIIEGENRNAACVACIEALRVMQQSKSVSSTWHAKLRSGTLQKEIQKIQALRDMSDAKFTSGKRCAMLIVPQDFRRVIMQRSVMQGPAYPVASAALAVLDQKISMKADSKPSAEFPAYALGEIQRAGARVAIFMRRGDTASYDPLSEESALLDKLQNEPNLVTLFVLWVPVQSGVEWDTADFRQRWRAAGPSETALEVILVPMDGAFDCQGFVTGAVEAALQKAAATAQQKLGRIGDMERAALKGFAGEVDKFQKDLASTQEIDPDSFHRRMVGTHHPRLRTLMQNISQSTENFKIPNAAFNKMHFESITTDTMEQQTAQDDGEDAGSPGGAEDGRGTEQREVLTCNELLCRSFHFHVLLGQCVQKCSKLAAKVYDEALTKLLNEIGEKEFFMDSEQILKELDIFCTRFKDNPEFQSEIDKLNLLKLLLTKQSFQHMYVGCVSYTLMPALYATVLPTLLKGSGGHEVPTDEIYVNYMREAKKMLEDGKRKRRASRASATPLPLR